MAKSDHGLPANSKATPRCISREEEELRWRYGRSKEECRKLGIKKMTLAEFNVKLNKLKKQGLFWRR